jgi:hypothetical protein
VTFRNGFGERLGTGFAHTGAVTFSNITMLMPSVDGAPPSSVYRFIDGSSMTSLNVSDFRARGPSANGITALFNLPNGATITSSSFTKSGGSGFLDFANIAGSISVNSTVVSASNNYHYRTNASGTVAAENDNVIFNSGGVSSMVAGTYYASWAAYIAAFPALNTNSANADPVFTGDISRGDFSVSGTGPASVGRTAGSRLTIARPNWSTLATAWSARYLGIDGTGP